MEVTVHDWPHHVLGIDAAKHCDPTVTAEHTAGCEGAGEGVLNPEGLPPVPGQAVHLHRRVGGHEASGPAHQHQVVSVGEGAGAESGGAEATLTRDTEGLLQEECSLIPGTLSRTVHRKSGACQEFCH